MTASADQQPTVRLTPSAQDKTASLIMSLVVMIGLAVVVLFLLWLGRFALGKNQTVAVELVELPGGGSQPIMGAGEELEEPGVEELPDLAEPQLTDMLAAVTDAITSQEAALDELATDSDLTGRGRGVGDRRAQGPGGDGNQNVVPRSVRWKIRYNTASANAYARQLDHFGIVLGVLGGGEADEFYIRNLAADSPAVSTSGAELKDWLYFALLSGDKLRDYQAQFAANADVRTSGRSMLQFYPPATEQQLARLELAHAGGRPVEEIQRTEFGVNSVGNGFEFSVIEQTYRLSP